ncbi:MAG TPA: sigma-70 family RNA polymerase sigma factor [Myxococcaceae bacterium]|nr:sigma-70 family RNA polymerase sigma factor [Myxococcaceae bacterium]
MEPPVRLDALYRRARPTLTAAVTRMLGPSHLDQVEAVVQEAFESALRTWPSRGPPSNPEGWLVQVAKNRALDWLRTGGRRERAGGEGEQEELSALPADGPDLETAARLQGELSDDQLAMMFVACHPSLSTSAQVMLALRTLCGLEAAEIAALLLSQEAAVEKALVRARARLREEGLSFEVPAGSELSARLPPVLTVLYALFSEGYAAHGGDRAVREDLCAEAMRLCRVLLDHPATRRPQVHALAALMLLQGSRLRARADERGRLLTLAEQDRSRWDGAMIRQGLEQLALSAAGEELTELHLEAGIAACHALAPSFQTTDWARIVASYDQLARLDPSPVVRLNRAIALSYAQGPARGLEALEEIAAEPELRRLALLEAARADLHSRLGEAHHARDAYAAALERAGSEQEKQLLRRRLTELE